MMDEKRTYGQFCGLARALDHVGDRWTLLVVRELLLGPRTFATLQAGLGGISPNLLVDRLRCLVDDGLVQRNDAPTRSKFVEYRLTAAGAALEPAVLALIRWGTRWMVSGPGDDQADPGWAPLALRALLEGVPATGASHGAVHVDVDGVTITVRIERRRRAVHPGCEGTAQATVVTPMPTLLAVASGLLPFADAAAAGLRVDGDHHLAANALTGASPTALDV